MGDRPGRPQGAASFRHPNAITPTTRNDLGAASAGCAQRCAASSAGEPGAASARPGETAAECDVERPSRTNARAHRATHARATRTHTHTNTHTHTHTSRALGQDDISEGVHLYHFGSASGLRTQGFWVQVLPVARRSEGRETNVEKVRAKRTARRQDCNSKRTKNNGAGQMQGDLGVSRRRR